MDSYSQIAKCVSCDSDINIVKKHFIHMDGFYWHINCFRCGTGNISVGCNRKLQKTNSKIIGSTPFCHKCYNMKYQPISSSSKINNKIEFEIQEIEKTEIIPPVDNINICFVGGVSTGKSTILNAIFCEELTQCKIKRTTMVPTIYIENESDSDFLTPSEDIFHLISEKNNNIIEKTENGEKISRTEYSELAFNVGKLDINILNDAYVNVYDIPGLNDARTKDIYYNYLEENFFKFNLVIFIVDIHSGLNTSDEIDIVNFITNNTLYQLTNNNKKIYTLVIVNKADDMQLDEESVETDKLMLTGELNEMYKQVEKTITTEFDRKGILEQLIGIMPLCAIDSYLYRMVKKHGDKFKLTPEQVLKIGINENGKKFSTLKPATQEKKVYEILQDQDFINTMIKLSGFSCLEKTLHKFLEENNTGNKIRVNNLLFNLSKLPSIIDALKIANSIVILEISSNIFSKHFSIYNNIKKIDEEMYNSLVSNLLIQIIEVLTEKVKKYTNISLLLDDYNKFVENVFNVYFVNFYTPIGYPKFIEDHILDLLTSTIKTSSSFTVEKIISALNALKKTNIYNELNINLIIKCIIGRSEGVYATYALSFDKFNEPQNYNELIDLLTELKEKNIEIIKLLRFILIYKIKSQLLSLELMYQRKMLYQVHNEIPISNYITQLLYGKVINETTFINGLDIKNDDKEFDLDIYYLSMVEHK